ncbi:MAG: M48 family metalloprotease [Armatimonadota bacterium]|nr:M48 family metalloprotease [Armatimonadota bacterium]
MKTFRIGQVILLLFALGGVWISPLAASDKDDDANEIKMGNEAVAEVEKQAKVISDPQLQARVDAIAADIVAVAESVQIPATYGNSRLAKFPYTFKIIDEKDANAFALPAGHVYINKGLMDFVQSDHELAGVIAHEIVHASHHHMLYLLREQSKLNNKLALVLLAAIVGNVQSRDLGNIVMGAQLLQIAKMSSYGVKAESDADRVAVDYLSRTKYNPVGLLTFIERLSRTTQLFEAPTIVQDHPSTGDRRATIIGRLNDLKIPIARRKVTNAAKAVPRTVKVNGVDAVEIAIDDKPLMRVADGPPGQPAAQRAQQIADKVNDLLDSNVLLKDIKAKDSEPVVIVKDKPFLRVTDDDAALSNMSAPLVAKSASDLIRSVVWKQMMDLAMIPTAKEKKGK